MILLQLFFDSITSCLFTGLQKLKIKLDQRIETRNLSMGRFKLKKRVESTPSSLGPPPQAVKWAVKSTRPAILPAETQTPPQRLQTSTQRMLTSEFHDCQQTPLSHHLHRANVLLDVRNNDSGDDDWNTEENVSSTDDV